MANVQAKKGSVEECIETCQKCHDECFRTAQHCLQMGGKHAEVNHVRLLANCIEICQTSVNFMLSGSRFQSRTCEVCAEVCDACAESCENIGANDEQMKLCADFCRSCAESCRAMQGMTGMAA